MPNDGSERDKPLDWVADCAEIFCGKPIHRGDRCVQLGNQLFCDEWCFKHSQSAKTVLAGREEFAI